MTALKKYYPGLVFTTLLGIIALSIQQIDFFQRMHFNSLIIAILLGMVIKNTMKVPDIFEPGISYSSKVILRLAIILLGFKLSLSQVMQIGLKGIILITIVTIVTFFFTLWLGKKMGLDRKLSMLIGAGIAICGASAIAAVAPIANAEEKDTTFAIATITIFGTLSMVIYPVLYRVFHLPGFMYAVWAGASIHEVAQVVAAGFAAGDDAGQMATLIKLSRVLLVIPMTILIGVFQFRGTTKKEELFSKLPIPWFVFFFLGVILLNSSGIVPPSLVSLLVSLNGILFTIAMAGLGLKTSLAQMRKVGIVPFYVGLFSTLFISILGLILTLFFFNE